MNLTKAFALVSLLLILSSTPGAAQEMRADRVYPRFAVGTTGVYVTIEKDRAVTVQDTSADSPAAGKFQQGDVLLAAGGRTLAVDDPRVPLGEALRTAEAGDGTLVFKVRHGVEADAGAEANTVTVRVPPLGPYSRTWPLNCRKSEAIIGATATFVANAQQDDGAYQFDKRPERDGVSGCLAGLFLLSTDDPAYLPNVRLQARQLAASVEKRPTQSTWHLGYQGILLAEYFLKTGDRAVLPGLKSLCDRAISTQSAGAWGHGGIPNPGYVQSGLMNSAGVPVLTTLILARECGVDVDEAGFLRSLKFFYRMAGHGNICYGDHRSELWWPNTNGRNAMLACALTLLDEPRYQAAARHLALLVADSYYKPEFGHTGGGFNVMWRGIGSVLVPDDRRSHYRRQLDRLAWYYDLCRQPGGGFSMLPTPPDNSRYTGLTWGTGAMGLTYTAPQKTLRITGAPRTHHSVQYQPPELTWGTEADLVFLSTDDAAGFGTELVNPQEVYERLIGKEKKNGATVGFCAQHLRHYSPMVRSWAARYLNEHPSAEATAALAAAVQHTDPRVRRAVYDSISGYDNWGSPRGCRIPRATVSKLFLPAICSALSDPSSAWWEIDGALFALGNALPDDIRQQGKFIGQFSEHEEWYLRQAAFWALDGLREFITPEEFQQLAAIYGSESRVYARASYDSGFKTIAKEAKITLDEETMKVFGETLGETLHKAKVTAGYDPDSGLHEAAHRTMMITKHFDPIIYRFMVDDLVKYLQIWTPYHQHSVWLITSSKWQPGILNVLAGLGEEGRPICAALKTVLGRYDQFDTNRIARSARDQLEPEIRKAVEAWEGQYGRIE